jgi:uncharacterized protein (TIGR03086 family)
VSEIAERWTRIADGFTARLEGVPPGAWSKQSPCPDWTAYDVAKHVIDVTRGLLTRLTGGDPTSPDTDEDLVTAWKVESNAVKAALADPDRARTEVKGMGGTQPFEALAGGVMCADTLIHTWDLARATGQDDRLDPEGIKAAQQFLEPNDAMLRRPGGFGDKLDASADADEQTRFLAFVGRQALP